MNLEASFLDLASTVYLIFRFPLQIFVYINRWKELLLLPASMILCIPYGNKSNKLS